MTSREHSEQCTGRDCLALVGRFFAIDFSCSVLGFKTSATDCRSSNSHVPRQSGHICGFEVLLLWLRYDPIQSKQICFPQLLAHHVSSFGAMELNSSKQIGQVSPSSTGFGASSPAASVGLGAVSGLGLGRGATCWFSEYAKTAATSRVDSDGFSHRSLLIGVFSTLSMTNRMWTHG